MTEYEALEIVNRAGEAGYFAEERKLFWQAGSGSREELAAAKETNRKVVALVGFSNMELGKTAIGIMAPRRGAGSSPTWDNLREAFGP